MKKKRNNYSCLRSSLISSIYGVPGKRVRWLTWRAGDESRENVKEGVNGERRKRRNREEIVVEKD